MPLSILRLYTCRQEVDRKYELQCYMADRLVSWWPFLWPTPLAIPHLLNWQERKEVEILLGELHVCGLALKKQKSGVWKWLVIHICKLLPIKFSPIEFYKMKTRISTRAKLSLFVIKRGVFWRSMFHTYVSCYLWKWGDKTKIWERQDLTPKQWFMSISFPIIFSTVILSNLCVEA